MFWVSFLNALCSHCVCQYFECVPPHLLTLLHFIVGTSECLKYTHTVNEFMHVILNCLMQGVHLSIFTLCVKRVVHQDVSFIESVVDYFWCTLYTSYMFWKIIGLRC